MDDMSTPPVVDIRGASTPRARARRRLQDLAAAARTAAATAADPDAVHPTLAEPRSGGRAWLNGHELGGARYEQLARAHD